MGGNESGTAEVCAFVSPTEGRRRFLFLIEVVRMNCPKCGKEMTRGTMHTRYYPFWTQQELKFFSRPTDQIDLNPLGGDNTSMFTRDPFPEYPDAMLCRDCGLVCFPCLLIEKGKHHP